MASGKQRPYAEMETRRVGRSGLYLSQLGLGAMTFGAANLGMRRGHGDPSRPSLSRCRRKLRGHR